MPERISIHFFLFFGHAGEKVFSFYELLAFVHLSLPSQIQLPLLTFLAIDALGLLECPKGGRHLHLGSLE